MTPPTGANPVPTLETLDQVVRFFQKDPQPYFYLSRSATNLLGLDRWVSGFHYICLSDGWDGTHPRVFRPGDVPALEPRGNIAIAQWLLQNRQVQEFIASKTPAGLTPKIIIAMFDERIERLCRSLGYELILPSAALRSRLDSKLSTTRLGTEAGAPSVPHVLTRVRDWDDLREQADRADLGPDLVVQLPYGDSGRTTYFLSRRADYEPLHRVLREQEIKVMRRIAHVPLAVEAVITRSGVFIGPVLREVTGHAELTRFRGGWAGSELYPQLLTPELRARARELTSRFCERLAAEGYRGILEVSILLDTDRDEVYLGELNPRISGSSPHSNLSPAPSVPPLFLFHLLEYSGAPFALDPNEFARRRDSALGAAEWSTLIIQSPAPRADRVESAPATGRYRVTAEGMEWHYVAADRDWHDLQDPDEAFWLRAVGAGELRSTGLDIGMLMLRRRVQEDDYALTERTRHLIRTVQRSYDTVPVPWPRVIWRAGLRKLRAFARR